MNDRYVGDHFGDHVGDHNAGDDTVPAVKRST
jgi:hypothetical protein